MSDKPTAVRVYLARVRTALADLPASEIEEILEDVRPHLAELEAELGESARVEALIERLGTPESYAAELRASGGYPPAAEGATQVLATAKSPSLAKPRIAFWGLVLCAVALALFAFAAAVRVDPDGLLGAVLFLPVFLVSLFLLLKGGVEPVLALPEVVWLRQALNKGRQQEDSGKALNYLASLKPAWWIVCAVVLIAFGLLLMLRTRSAVLLLPFLLVAGGAAVWAGPRLRRDRRLLWVAVPISAFVIGGILGGFGAAVDLISHRNSYSSSPSYYPSSSDRYGNEQLSYGNREIENVYAFDAEGKPLTEVYLYDEQGRPITLTRYGCERSSGTKEKIGEDNRFPRPKIDQGVTDDQGNYNGYNGYRSACREDAGVPFSAAIPKVTVPPTATTTPAPTTTATPPPSTTPTR
ncbi:hypothetical protein Amsp01_098030 [Amycolatopsis sp. NBRC 101858]|uniref:DUF1700 domain-containing protein n=1 Tax=Amycolatopsis sp. NBRC 101858 TaxID=3032200 RepID=UPI0024A26668|nr:hypothetical protein [Amycolatopsis sp. NBRC 101858]GLY43780.1 hypothetical protein Amsp01_098030 [Amycolatopsis sp. NBRC 101858]